MMNGDPTGIPGLGGPGIEGQIQDVIVAVVADGIALAIIPTAVLDSTGFTAKARGRTAFKGRSVNPISFSGRVAP